MILGNDGKSVTAITYGGYVSGERPIMDLQQENNILKQRCAAHATPNTCKLCQFTCSYRKKWSCSNRD